MSFKVVKLINKIVSYKFQQNCYQDSLVVNNISDINVNKEIFIFVELFGQQ